jgi:uncharacterized protein YggU (UPF0235/DUF167 family)
MFLKLKVHPGARENKLVRKAPDAYEAWVKAPAERGLANDAVLALLAAGLGVPRARLRLVKGATSPSKIVTLLGGS